MGRGLTVATRLQMGTSRDARPYWIDLDNAPHVVTFAPIIAALKARGRPVIVTARDVNRTPALASRYGLQPLVSGRAFGASRLRKILGTLQHGLHLALSIRHLRPRLAISHGSRSQAVAARLLGIRSVLFFDYEKADLRIFRMIGSRHYYPEVLDSFVRTHFGLAPEQRVPYPGLKEHLALLTSSSDTSELRAAGLPVEREYAVLRPESDTAHYLETHDDTLLLAALARCESWNMVPVIVPRSDSQERRLRQVLPREGPIFPTRQVNGIDLLRHARVLISGGGTMNREAAVVGTPCVSIFRGRLGEIDRGLIASGRMIHVTKPEQFQEILLERYPASNWDSALRSAWELLEWLVDRLEEDWRRA